MNPLEYFILPAQKTLFSSLCKMYKGQIEANEGSYILVKGEAPILLVAHLDTVHDKCVRQICKTSNGNILMSPQGIGGDDRCGVYALAAIYEQSRVKPWLLFTCDEEIGGVGAARFCADHRSGGLPDELDNMKIIIEIDRKGENDAVYYECDNPEFEAYITSKGFKTEFGSFSDISYVAPELGTAAVNLSSGYYNAHTLHEYINRKHLNATIKKVVEIVSDTVAPDFPTYEYRENEIYRYANIYDSYRGCYLIDPIPDSVPEHIQKAYYDLLDFYSVEELEDIRKNQGDEFILILFETEFGVPYQDWHGTETEMLTEL